MNDVEVFETRREFRKKFVSRLYICNYCKLMTPDPNVCVWCGKQANQLFSDGTYKYIIKSEQTEVQQIFKPIELEKGNYEYGD